MPGESPVMVVLDPVPLIVSIEVPLRDKVHVPEAGRLLKFTLPVVKAQLGWIGPLIVGVVGNGLTVTVISPTIGCSIREVVILTW